MVSQPSIEEVGWQLVLLSKLLLFWENSRNVSTGFHHPKDFLDLQYTSSSLYTSKLHLIASAMNVDGMRRMYAHSHLYSSFSAGKHSCTIVPLTDQFAIFEVV